MNVAARARVGKIEVPVTTTAQGFRVELRENGKRVRRTFSDLDAAKKCARDHALALSRAMPGLDTVTPEEWLEFRQWQKSRGKASVTLEEARTLYIAARKAEGHFSERYWRGIVCDTEILSKALRTVSTKQVTVEQIEVELNKLKAGSRRKNNVRATWIGWFRWLRERGYLPANEKTAPERAAKAKATLAKPVTVYSPDELRDIIAAVAKEYLAWVVIGAFAGIRTGEIMRLNWGHIKINKGHIDVPPSVDHKTGRRRLVPIQPNLAKWLKLLAPGDDSAPVCSARTDRATAKISGWKINALRHSYGSYRCAITGDPARVAYEMGNSPQMVMKHYHEAQEPETAAEWFQIEPSE